MINRVFTEGIMDKHQSLHAYVKEEILNKIRKGDYKIGDKIPTEHALCESFGVSRTTIRTALNQLTVEGYLIRHQGRGTFVAEQKVKQSLTQTVKKYKDQVAIQGKEATIKVISISVVPADSMLASVLKVDQQAPIQRIERIRYANGEPTQYEVAYVPWDIAPGITAEQAEVSLYDTLQTTFHKPITFTSEKIELTLADEIIASHLQYEENAPCFYIETVTKSHDDEIIEFSKAFFRGDKTSFTIERAYN